jgi:hypothetical protein
VLDLTRQRARFQIIVNAAQNLADNAVEYEPVSVPANREIYRDLAVSGLYSAAFASNLGRIQGDNGPITC